MPQVHDESHGGACGPSANPPRGLLPYPEGVTARASGWLTPVGTMHGIYVERIETPDFAWDRIFIEEMRFARAAALLLVQGIHLSMLFPPDLTLYDKAQPVLWFRAPLVLLGRAALEVSQVPPKVRGVVLGVVVRAGGLSEDAIRARMLETVLG